MSEFSQLFLSHMLSLESILGFCHGTAKGGDYKVIFFQSCVGFIPCQIACNLAIRYLVFRWELCKGSVCESVKKAQEVYTRSEERRVGKECLE